MTSTHEAVRFEVTYRLGEYQQFVLEHVRHTVGKEIGALTRFFISKGAALAFLLKSRKIGHFIFTIDEWGILRESRRPDLTIPWPDVVAVHRYSPGLLIEKATGAVPIPYRCLDDGQRSQLDTFVRRWEEST